MKNQNPPKHPPRVEKSSDSGFTGFTGFTPEQVQRIHKLDQQGMSEALAREEVLGKGWVEP